MCIRIEDIVYYTKDNCKFRTNLWKTNLEKIFILYSYITVSQFLFVVLILSLKKKLKQMVFIYISNYQLWKPYRVFFFRYANNVLKIERIKGNWKQLSRFRLWHTQNTYIFIRIFKYVTWEWENMLSVKHINNLKNLFRKTTNISCSNNVGTIIWVPHREN